MFNNTTHTHFLPTSSTNTSQSSSGLNGAAYAFQSNLTPSTSDARLQSPSSSGIKKRKSSKMKSGKQSTRSLSTPQLLDTAGSDSDSSDKKRNKLGKEIRAQCQNCIRLKKDCVFYPVDQQTAMDQKPDSSAQLLSGSAPSSVVSASPSTHGGLDRPFAATQEFPAFSAVPSNAPSAFGGLPLEPGNALVGQNSLHSAHTPFATESEAHTGRFVHSDNPYQAENDMRSWSDAPRMHAGQGSMLNRQQETPSQLSPRYDTSPGVKGDYAPFPTADPRHLPGRFHQGFDLAPSTPESLWQQSQPSRSFSYGQVDQHSGPPQQYQPDFRSHQQLPPQQFQYPLSSLDVQNATMMHDDRGPHSAPVGIQQPYGQANPFAFQQPRRNVENASFPHQQAYSAGWLPRHHYGSMAEEPRDYEGGEQRPG
ncbi:hypothetical protein LTR15_001245 [Elasticomyces elasticus]|nr:hypothetical protein LTR15_001245 [Elasticomyces elasticus]